MTIEACAELVQRGDPDRFMSAMTAPIAARENLFVLYAFNLEIARAPWVTKEAMIAEMRLQWWLDAVEEIYAGGDVRRHEVVTPLVDVIRENNLPRDLLDALINARRWDIYKEPHNDLAAFEAYIRDTAGALLALSAMATGAGADTRPALLEYGYGVGLAAMFRAIPALENAQRYPLIDGRNAAVGELASDGLIRLHDAGAELRNIVKPARAALRSGWMAKSVLRDVIANPALVANDGLVQSEFSKKFRLLHLSFRNRF
ncbi:phytoene synthase [Amylibacter ulvae]|uniref:Phytoene synthase n=1 Tax=Paramylibacter ulvae TaxID=1651968 RepID=A0ABQ3CXK6_9RHOB|nr:squalene/phytoene synthase family protein [Amylibacter ulvae]GHA43363.1 phytoene synthase [Amylibacter ulvae]